MITLDTLIHDTNGKLNTINACANNLKDKYPDDPDVQRWCALILQRQKETFHLHDQFYLDHRDNETLKFKKDG